MNKIKKEPIVSIIIPFYNLGEYLEEAIVSCLNQTYKNIEIIVINDGSTDEKSINILSDLKIKYKNKVKFIDQKNLGVAKARNNGIKFSKGEYICCLDADDTIEPTYIEKTKNLLKKHKNFAIVTTQLIFFENMEGIWNPSDKIVDLLVENCIHVASLFRKSAWKKVHGYTSFTNRGFEDWDFWLKIVSIGYSWGIINEPLFNYRVRANSMVTKSHKKRFELMKRNINHNIQIYKEHIADVIFEIQKRNALKLSSNLTDSINKYEKVIEEENDKYRKLEACMSDLQIKYKISLKNNSKLMSKNESLIEKINNIRIENESLTQMNELLRNDIVKITSTKGWQLLEILRNIKKSNFGLIKIRSEIKLIRYKLITISKHFNIKNGNIKFSIGIPSYNHSEYIEKCIKSCINQTYKNYEIIIVDDNSTDTKTIQILKLYKTKYPEKIKLIKKNRNEGISNSLNDQILNSKGEYFLMVDCDDFIEPNTLQTIYKFVKKNNYDYIFTDRKQINENGQLMSVVEYGGFKNLKDLGVNIKNILSVGMAASHLKIFKFDTFRKNGLISNIFSQYGCQDYEYALRCVNNGMIFGYINEPLYNYRWYPKSFTLKNHNKQIQGGYQLRKLYKIRNYLNSIKHIKNQKNKIKAIILLYSDKDIFNIDLKGIIKNKNFKIINIYTNHKLDGDNVTNYELNSSLIYEKIKKEITSVSFNILLFQQNKIFYKILPSIYKYYPKPYIVEIISSMKLKYLSYSANNSIYIDHKICFSSRDYKKLLANNISLPTYLTSTKNIGIETINKIYSIIKFDKSILSPVFKKTSICILNLNRYKALDNLLTSIKKFTKLPYEILILDQNSDEDTKRYLKSLNDDKIKVFYSDKNIGCSGGRKYLIEKAKGDYIVQLDNDLEVKESWLEKLISSIDWNDKIVGACGRVTFPDGKTEYNGASYSINGNYITYTLDDNGKNVDDLSLLVENYSMWLPGGATIFKSSVFKNETYDEKFLNGFEDNDLSFRLEKRGWKFVNSPTCVFIHNHRMFLSVEDLKKDKRYLKQRNNFSRTKASFLRFYKKHNLIINDPELWKLMGFSEKKEVIEKELKHIVKNNYI